MKNKIAASVVISLVLMAVLVPIASAQGAGGHKNGTLVSSNGTFYLIKDGQRQGFRTWGEFLSWGYEPAMVVPANVEDMRLPEGSPLRARAGTLAIDASDGRTMYFIFGDTAQPVTSPLYLMFLNFEGRAYYYMDLSSYEKGSARGFDLVYLQRPVGALVSDGSTVFLVTAEGLSPFPSYPVFRSHGYDFKMLFQINSEDRKLPTVAAMRYRDGALVNDGGTIFLMSEGKKFGFKSWQGFLAGGYSPSVVIDGSTAGYQEGESFE